MTCQRCPEPATVHLTETVQGRPREAHLCVECARKAGLTFVGPPPELPLDAILDAMIAKHVGGLVRELATLGCPICGLPYMDFRIEGRLGCPHDYVAFRSGLEPLLRQAQAATRHVGKSPRRRVGDQGGLRLRALLRSAIAAEDYETAAQIRDQLRQRGPQA